MTSASRRTPTLSLVVVGITLASVGACSGEPGQPVVEGDSGTRNPSKNDTQATDAGAIAPRSDASSEVCVPRQDAFDANVRPIIEEKCAQCHGEVPNFGAPFGLLEYAPLVQGSVGTRIVDKMVRALADNRMPPAGFSRPSHNEFDTLIGWASCGLEHPDYSENLSASRPVFEAPTSAPEGAIPLELTAQEHFVDVDALDAYRNFRFQELVERDFFIQRIEPIIDESRVVHHITLRSEESNSYLYTWAPGTGAIEFPDGGLRVSPEDAFVVQAHYNNGAGIPDVYDSSGVRLWIGEPEGTEWGMLSTSANNIYVPPKAITSSSSSCTSNMDFRVLAGMPHMHEIGSEFRHTLVKASGTEESLIRLSGWSFELQYFYQMDTLVTAGDRLDLTCTYENDKDHAVTGGLGTTDEMCFDFLYVAPAAAAHGCQ